MGIRSVMMEQAGSTQWQDLTTIVFDFDGTLASCPYDFPYMRQAVLQAAIDFGLKPAQLGELGLLETIEVGAELLGDGRQAEDFRRLATRRLCEIEYEAAAKTFLLPGVVNSLHALHDAGLRLGVVTRNSTAAVQRIVGETVLPLRAMLCREDVPLPKPHPDHAFRLLQLLDRTPDQALMVGDHPMDISMGRAARMRTAAVLTGQSSEDALRAETPDFLLPSVVELTQTLLEMRNSIS